VITFIDFDNIEEPVQSLVEEIIFLPLDGSGETKVNKKIGMALNEAKFQDNFFQAIFNEKKEVFTTMNSIRDFFKSKIQSPNVIFNLDLSLDRKVKISTRRVYSLLDCLGDVGGFYDALFLISAFFVGTLPSDLFMAKLIRTLFRIASTDTQPLSNYAGQLAT